jgi:hypothetical protein
MLRQQPPRKGWAAQDLQRATTSLAEAPARTAGGGRDAKPICTITHRANPFKPTPVSSTNKTPPPPPTTHLQHPGGEFKGIQPVYGTNGTNDQDLLFGARRPHKPFNFTLEPGEVRGRGGQGGIACWVAVRCRSRAR